MEAPRRYRHIGCHRGTVVNARPWLPASARRSTKAGASTPRSYSSTDLSPCDRRSWSTIQMEVPHRHRQIGCHRGTAGNVEQW